MDYYCFDSDIIESLNLLRPPVRRETNSNTVPEPSNNLNLKAPNLAFDASHQDSSTSVVLEKFFKTQILKQYSVLKYTDQQEPLKNLKPDGIKHKKEKPLIKVTVIPKSGKAEPKLLRKRRIPSKTIQATSSDHNNSVKTKNLYLVVAGRREDKIYEIKTTGSAKFETDRHDSVGGRHRIFHSFAMDRKNKKGLKKDRVIEKDNVEEPKHVCKCCPGDGRHDAGISIVKPAKSRVKIFGKLGLTQNDKYVLKCHATVDDKPVPSFISQERLSDDSGNRYEDYNKCDCANAARAGDIACVRRDTHDSNISSPRSFGSGGGISKRDKYHDEASDQRDCRCIYPDYRLKAVNDLLFEIEQKYNVRKESQSTQVDLNILSTSLQLQQSPRTQNICTKCTCAPEYPKTLTNDVNNLQSCQSPLVVISVFPKQDNLQLDVLKAAQEGQTIPRQSGLTNMKNRTTECDQVIEEDKPNQKVTRKNKSKSRSSSPRSRSPSPKSLKGKSKDTEKFRKGRAEVRAKNRKVDQKTPSKQTLQFFNSKLKREGKSKIGSSKSHSKQIKSIGLTPDVPDKIVKSKSKAKRKVEIGINTEHLQTKKALVDSYTKRILEHTNQEKSGPSISKVSINIDGEKEFYDLILQQDNKTTDLNVRRTMKETSTFINFPQQKEKDESNLNSPRRYSGKKNVSPSSADKQSKDIVNAENTNRRLTVRDSLEIFHRREEKCIKAEKGLSQQVNRAVVNPTKNDIDFTAPMKHFLGDSCAVCDPIERDKEIRKLLGVTSRFNKFDSRPPRMPVSPNSSYHSKRPMNTAIALTEDDSKDLETNGYFHRPCNVLQILKQTTGRTQKYSEANASCSNDYVFKDEKSEPFIVSRHKACHRGIVCPDVNCEKMPGQHVNFTKQMDTYRREICGLIESGKYCNFSTNENVNPSDRSLISNKSNNKINYKCDSCTFSQKADKGGSPKNRRCHHSDNKNMLERDSAIDNFRDSKTASKACKNAFNDSKDDQRVINDMVSAKQLTLNRNVQVFLQMEQFSKQKPIVLSRKQYKKVKKTIQRTLSARDREIPVGKQGKKCQCKQSIVSVGQIKEKTEKSYCTPVVFHQEVQTDKTRRSVHCNMEGQHRSDMDMIFLHESPRLKESKVRKVFRTHAESTIEVRYSSIAVQKKEAFSFTNIPSIENFPMQNKDSIETIFRGHKRSMTPNLGTSMLYLQSSENITKSNSLRMMRPDAKTKKPFLKRLISCLVMKSRASVMERSEVDLLPTTANSSVDSYHLSSSFGAIEMSSSLYDTSASFHSDHGIYPLNSKLKRSFFSTFKGFLASRSKT